MSFLNEDVNLIRKKLQLCGLDIQSNSNFSISFKKLSKLYSELFFKSDYRDFPKFKLMENKIQFNEMIIIRDVQFISICEHHLLIIEGTSTVAYIPKKYIVGLSKISQIIHFFSKRPQLQEKMTKQISISLKNLLKTEDVAVFINAVHYCMKIRYAQDRSSDVVTTELSGSFVSDNLLKDRFLRFCYSNR
ncbi:GTP cyclohydrolase I [Candidatus Riesia pediculischaeffi]|uniref:GTP cyclohydrolase I n=1 Tax=Candidatus Riesia pediculischaeffi TaxID=428411 RepID=A0A1V0HJW3_9ENTR|nr:GTP cyclohydrolase I [Candidatus Riesia pediculischaeffi]ARC53118.1 hypothetical protein AOQ87_00120 [Candidatus Riesia pediculischaeffi]